MGLGLETEYTQSKMVPKKCGNLQKNLGLGLGRVIVDALVRTWL